MTRTIKASLLGSIFVASLMSAVPASAQIGACPTLMPPPCLVFDYKKLADMATKRAQDVAKIKSLGNEISQWKGTADAIGSTIGQVKGLANENLFSGFGDFGDLDVGSVGSLMPKAPNIGGIKNNVSNVVYAGAGANNAEIMKANGYRQSIGRAANVDALALRYTINKQVSNTDEAMLKLGKAMEDSTNLRSDWAVNSQVRNEIVRANALQDYLWQSYLTMKSSKGIGLSDVATAKGGMPAGTMTGVGASTNTSADWLKVQQLQALAAEAARLKSSLGIVKSGQEVRTLIEYNQAQRDDAILRKDRAYQDLVSAAGRWARETDNSNVTSRQNTIMTNINAALTSYDNLWASRRTLPMSSLYGYLDESQIDYGKMIEANDGVDPSQDPQISGTQADPRQYLGSWADPAKNKKMATLAYDLRKGSLRKYIDGDNGTDSEMDRLIQAYNDTRQEIDWQKDSYADTVKSLAGTDAEIAKVQSGETVNLDDNSVWQRIQAIAQEANGIGQQLQGSTDSGLIAAAQVPINELQAIVSAGIPGLQLPAVDGSTQLEAGVEQQIQGSTYVDLHINPFRAPGIVIE